MQYPKISIITPTYNAAKTIKECLESVAKQNYPNLEHWIIDGLSQDNTLTIVREFAEKYPHIHYVSEKDKGIYDAMNKGIDLVKGEYLLFLGSDDKLAENIINILTQNICFEEYDLIYGKVQHPTKTFGAKFEIKALTQEILLSPFIHLFVHHQGSFIRKHLFELYGKYDLKYTVGADIVFLIKIIGSPKVKKLFYEEVFSTISDDGISSKKPDLQMEFDFPELAQKYLNLKIDTKKYYRNYARYHFYELYQKNIFDGLKGIIKLMYFQGDVLYYLKNTLYWLKKRLNSRPLKSFQNFHYQ